MTQGRRCWYRPNRGILFGKWTAGLFHRWGTDKGLVPREVSFTVGIIEDNETGSVSLIHPERVHFGTDPEQI